jgi:D-alanyl-D-alanine dipeptidase
LKQKGEGADNTGGKKKHRPDSSQPGKIPGNGAGDKVEGDCAATAVAHWEQEKTKADKGRADKRKEVSVFRHNAKVFHFFVVMGTAFANSASGSDLVRARRVIKDLVEDIRYGTTNNFTGKDLYGGFKECWLLPSAATMLAAAEKSLRRHDRNLRLVVYDCARPQSVQRVMWDVVKDTPQREYVADPAKGSVHNYGCAVDLGIVRDAGRGKRETLDMGTPFDHFGPEAHTTEEAQMLLDGKLSREALRNRLLLRSVMVEAGFFQLPHEWWHFDCMKLDALKAAHKPVPDLKSLR